MIKEKELKKLDMIGTVIYIIAIIILLFSFSIETKEKQHIISDISLTAVFIYEFYCNRYIRRKIEGHIER